MFLTVSTSAHLAGCTQVRSFEHLSAFFLKKQPLLENFMHDYDDYDVIFLFFISCVWMLACVWLCTMSTQGSTCGGRKRALDPPELELQTVWAVIKWVPETEPGFSSQCSSLLSQLLTGLVNHFPTPFTPLFCFFCSLDSFFPHSFYFLIGKHSHRCINQTHQRHPKLRKHKGFGNSGARIR